MCTGAAVTELVVWGLEGLVGIASIYREPSVCQVLAFVLCRL